MCTSEDFPVNSINSVYSYICICVFREREIENLPQTITGAVWQAGNSDKIEYHSLELQS